MRLDDCKCVLRVKLHPSQSLSCEDWNLFKGKPKARGIPVLLKSLPKRVPTQTLVQLWSKGARFYPELVTELGGVVYVLQGLNEEMRVGAVWVLERLCGRI